MRVVDLLKVGLEETTCNAAPEHDEMTLEVDTTEFYRVGALKTAARAMNIMRRSKDEECSSPISLDDNERHKKERSRLAGATPTLPPTCNVANLILCK